MAIDNFIPEVWAAALLEEYNEAAVIAGLVNRQYEGVASRGSTVHITGVVQPAIKDYAAAGRTTSAEAISDTGVDLPIDQEKNFDFYVDDIDRAQAAGSFDMYTTSASEGLAEDADKYIGSVMATNGTAITAGAEATSGETAFNVIRDLRKALNKAHVPASDRVVLVNGEFDALLLEAAAKITNVDTSGSPAGLRNATLGQLLGFRTVVTENLPVTDRPQAIGYHRRAVAYVSQIDKVEAMRAQDRFADRTRGLHVYGATVTKPEGIAVYTTPAA